MICENCEKEHDGSYGSGRFCSAKCARGFSTKNKRKEINEKVSNAMKLKYENGELSVSHLHTKEAQSYSALKRREAFENKIQNTDFVDLSRDMKRKYILDEQQGKCNHCGIDEWQGCSITLELEHIDGNSQNDNRTNLEMICPNCHSLTKTWRGRNTKQRVSASDDEIIEALKKSKSIHQALVSLGMTPKGGNYDRVRKIVEDAVGIEPTLRRFKRPLP